MGFFVVRTARTRHSSLFDDMMGSILQIFASFVLFLLLLSLDFRFCPAAVVQASVTNSSSDYCPDGYYYCDNTTPTTSAVHTTTEQWNATTYEWTTVPATPLDPTSAHVGTTISPMCHKCFENSSQCYFNITAYCTKCYNGYFPSNGSCVANTTTARPTTSPPNNIALIIGVVVGSVAGIALVAVAIVVVLWRKGKLKRSSTPPNLPGMIEVNPPIREEELNKKSKKNKKNPRYIKDPTATGSSGTPPRIESVNYDQFLGSPGNEGPIYTNESEGPIYTNESDGNQIYTNKAYPTDSEEGQELYENKEVINAQQTHHQTEDDRDRIYTNEDAARQPPQPRIAVEGRPKVKAKTRTLQEHERIQHSADPEPSEYANFGQRNQTRNEAAGTGQGRARLQNQANRAAAAAVAAEVAAAPRLKPSTQQKPKRPTEDASTHAPTHIAVRNNNRESPSRDSLFPPEQQFGQIYENCAKAKSNPGFAANVGDDDEQDIYENT